MEHSEVAGRVRPAIPRLWREDVLSGVISTAGRIITLEGALGWVLDC